MSFPVAIGVIITIKKESVESFNVSGTGLMMNDLTSNESAVASKGNRSSPSMYHLPPQNTALQDFRQVNKSVLQKSDVGGARI